MKKTIAIILTLVLCISVVSMVAFADTTTYYLIGYLNGADYGFGDDAANMGEYKFVNGKLSTTFTQDSYVFLKTEGNGAWFMTDAYVDGNNGTFKNTEGGSSEKMKVPGNVQVNFTLVENADGTINLSYTTGNEPTTTEPTTTQPTTTQPTTTQPTTTQPTTTTQNNSTKRTLTIKAPASWKTVNLYTWTGGDNNVEAYGAYPGSPVTKSGDVYKLDIDKSIVNMVINGVLNDETPKKTNDIALLNNGANVTITINEDCSFKIEYEGTTGGIGTPPAEDPTTPLSNYRVVGDAAWMGAWKADSDLGRMHDMGNGVYRKNFDNVEPGSYQLKITKDGKWDNAYGDENGQNYTFTVVQKCKITVDFTLKGDVGVITVYGEGVPKTADVSMVSVVILMALASVTAIVLVVNKKKFI